MFEHSYFKEKGDRLLQSIVMKYRQGIASDNATVHSLSAECPLYTCVFSKKRTEDKHKTSYASIPQ
jgi:hypothetical protein